MRILKISLVLASLSLAMPFMAIPGIMSANALAADLLTIGSDAPALNVEHWVQNGNGKFKPVTKFEKGKVYVVEFWATWCGPCIQSMPHLAQLQTEYADKGVQLVSISDEDLETVEKFLEREVRGAAPAADAEAAPKKTYRELTSAYCLTTDPDQSSYKDYMDAAAQNGIPTAFLVGKDGKVEWLGHPMELDGPLTAVVADSWDREAFALEMRAQQEAEKAMNSILALLRTEDFDGALKLIDETLAKADNIQLKMLKLQVLIAAQKKDAAAEHLSAIYNALLDDTNATNMVAWNIYEMAAQGRLEEDPKKLGKDGLLIASVAAIKVAIQKSADEEKASNMDTLAHLLFVQGELDQAIAIETEAFKLSGERDRDFIKQFIKQLADAKADADKPEADEKETEAVPSDK